MPNMKTERGRNLPKIRLQVSSKAGIQTHCSLQRWVSLHRSFCELFPLDEYTDQNLINSSLAFTFQKNFGERNPHYWLSVQGTAFHLGKQQEWVCWLCSPGRMPALYSGPLSAVRLVTGLLQVRTAQKKQIFCCWERTAGKHDVWVALLSSQTFNWGYTNRKCINPKTI